MFISNDLTHDYHAVQNFMTATMKHLRCQRHLEVEHVVQWTDGCSSQYKSKDPFADLAFSSDDFATQVGHHFWHGKGSSYSESGGRRRFRRTCVHCTNPTRMWARSDISNISNCITAISLQISPQGIARNKFDRVEGQRDIRTWQDVTIAELKTYYGLLFLMEVMKFDRDWRCTGRLVQPTGW